MTKEEIQKKVQELRQAINKRAEFLAGQDPQCARLAGQVDVYEETLKEMESEEPTKQGAE